MGIEELNIKNELENYARQKYSHIAISIDNVHLYEEDIEKSSIEVTVVLDIYTENYVNCTVTGKGLFSKESFIDYTKIVIDDIIKNQVETYFYKIKNKEEKNDNYRQN